MADDPQAALAAFAAGVRALLADEDYAYANPSERAWVARLAVLLEGNFPDWSISTEWDRREDLVKRLRYQFPIEALEREAMIVPDLIIHRIGKRENLLVVEVKRIANRDYDKDIWKLRGMTAQAGDYGYAAGLHLVVNLPRARVERCDVYVDGERDAGLTAWLREQLP
jgi:hypothetical protein